MGFSPYPVHALSVLYEFVCFSVCLQTASAAVLNLDGSSDIGVCVGVGLSYVRVSRDTSSFLAFVRRVVRVFGPIRKYIRTLPIAKAYDGLRQRKLVSFQ